MKTILFRFFTENWQRKSISLIAAIVIWMSVSQMMTMTKVIANIPVRVMNLPADKTIEGMQVNGILNKKITLSVVGNKAALKDLSAKDFEVVIDAKDSSHEWVACIEKKHLVSLNPDFIVSQMVSRVLPHEIIIRQSNLVKERIPIVITHPIGDVPRGYQFLDVWPYQLFVTVTGPEETVKNLKGRGLKLTFNLNEIPSTELDRLFTANHSDEVSFTVPEAWKKIAIPQLSETPLEIDDPQAKLLRVDFSKHTYLPIHFPVPVTVFFPPKSSDTLNPDTYQLAASGAIMKKNGIKQINIPLEAYGVSPLFLDIVKDMLQISVIASPKAERDTLMWHAQFMYPHELENRYVARVLSESDYETEGVQPNLREDYVRNRFRSYMNRFRLYTEKHTKLALKIELQANTIAVTAEE